MAKKNKTDELAEPPDQNNSKAATSPVNRIRFNSPRKNKIGLIAGIAMFLTWVLVMSVLAFVVNFG